MVGSVAGNFDPKSAGIEPAVITVTHPTILPANLSRGVNRWIGASF